jgi:hypothetical protein
MKKKLISIEPKNSILDFISTDNEKVFKKNLKKKKKENWLYKTKKISYQTNEQGFRNKPFEEVAWEDSIVVLGCSNVFGVGLAVEDTLCFQLEKILNIPVVNLGVGGTGIDFACWNSLRLHNFYPRPKAIVQIWSSLGRYTDYNNHDHYVCYIPHQHSIHHRLNWTYRSLHYIESDKALWKNKAIYYEGSFFHDNYFTMYDQARDLMHPGIKSNLAAAEKIAENLTKQGI